MALTSSAGIAAFFLGLIDFVSCLSCRGCVGNPCSLQADPFDTTTLYTFCNHPEGSMECLRYSSGYRLCPSRDLILNSGECQRAGFPTTQPSMPDKNEAIQAAVWDCEAGVIRTDTQRCTGFDIRKDIEGNFFGPGHGSPNGSSYTVKVNICSKVTSTTEFCTKGISTFQAQLNERMAFNPCIEIEDVLNDSGVVPISLNSPKNLMEGFNVSLGHVRCCSGNTSNYIKAVTVFKSPENCSGLSNNVPSLQNINLNVVGKCSLDSELIMTITLPQFCESCKDPSFPLADTLIYVIDFLLIVLLVCLAVFYIRRTAKKRECISQEESMYSGCSNSANTSMDRTSIVLTSILSVEEFELTKKGFSLNTSDGFCSVVIPKDAVDLPINIVLSVFSGTNKHFSKSRKPMSNIVQMLPYNVQLKKPMTLKLKHNFILNKHHPPNVTIFHDECDGEFLILCTLTAMNEVTTFKGGSAVLLSNEIVLKMETFCRVYCSTERGCLRLYSLAFLSSAMRKLTDFESGVVMKMAITTKGDENRWKREKQKRYTCEDEFGFDVCICDLDKFSKKCQYGTRECPTKCENSFAVKVKVVEGKSSIGKVTPSEKFIHLSHVRSVAENPENYLETFDFAMSLKFKDPDQFRSLTSIVVKIKITQGPILLACRQFRVEIQPANLVGYNQAIQSAPTTLVGRITTENLIDLSKCLQQQWKSFGRLVGMQDKIIDQIDTDYKDSSAEKAYQVLHLWIQKPKNDSTEKQSIEISNRQTDV